MNAFQSSSFFCIVENASAGSRAVPFVADVSATGAGAVAGTVPGDPALIVFWYGLVATLSQDQQKRSRPPTSVMHGPTTHSLQLPAHKCERRHMRAAPALVSALSGSFGPASHGSSASAVGHFVVFV